jgi:hypothetical protein
MGGLAGQSVVKSSAGLVTKGVLKRSMKRGASVLIAASVMACGGGSSGDTTPHFAEAHPKILLNDAPTLARLKQDMANKTPQALRLKAFVDNEMAQPGTNYGFAAWFAALMYKVTGDTVYADFAISRIDKNVAAEEALIASGERAGVAYDSYLYVGDGIGDVALVYDWCFERVTPTQRSRWIAYMNQAVANVWNPEGATWGGKSFPWSGWSVNNPSNNYYYSFLRATMLLGLATRGENAQAQQWIDQFRTTKIANELVPTFQRDLSGGGSREGTSYGDAMKTLFMLYDWWGRSTGERIADLTPHALASEAWMLHNITPTLDHLAVVGDHARESSGYFFDYNREYLLALMSLYPQERMSAMAKAVLDDSSLPKMAYNFEAFADYIYQPPTAPAAKVADLSSAYWGAGTGQLLMRSRWGDKTAAFSQFSCGPYTESHAHQDQGAFQIFRGEWLAPTGNMYSHSGIQQGVDFNNLVRFVQAGQNIFQDGADPACKLAALADNDDFTYASAQVTPAYASKPAVSKVEREYLFIKPGTFVVFDRVAASAGVQRVWTLNLASAPVLDGDHLSFTGSEANKLDVYRVAPTGLSYLVLAPTLDGGDWLLNTAAKRVDVVDTTGTQSLFLHVLGTNGSVSAVTRSDATGQTGVQINLADGRKALVRFANAAPGGTLELRQADGTVLRSGALPTTVVAPPLFRN